MNRKNEASHKRVIQLRPLEFLYDSTYIISSEKTFYKIAARAVDQMSEKDIRPHFESMFSDVSRYPRIQFVRKTENIPLSWTIPAKCTSQNGVNGRNMVQYVTRSTSDILDKLRLEQIQTPAHTVCINGIHEKITSAKENTTKTVSKKRKTVCTRGTQTDFRDSETQTDIWIPSYSLIDRHISNIFYFMPESGEVSDTNVFPEKYKITDLERKLSKSKKNLNAQIAITRQIQRIKWLIKEKQIDYVNEIRMELAENTLSEHNVQIETTISRQETARAYAQEMVTNQKLQLLRKKKDREIRKIYNRTPKVQFTSTILDST